MINKSLKISLLFFLCFMAFIVNAQETNKLKVLSYNIMEGMKLDPSDDKSDFTTWIKSFDPDVFAIEEANNFTQKSLEKLAASYDHHYAVLLKEDGFPVAITSKYPIVNVSKVVDNFHHGFIKAQINGYNFIVLHLTPFDYIKRNREIACILETISMSSNDKWLIMGDFNSCSPMDKESYLDKRLAQQQAAAAKKNSRHNNVVDGQVDFTVVQNILDRGFVDTVRKHGKCYNFTAPTKKISGSNQNPVTARVDYLFVSPDLEDKIIKAEVIKDDFTHMHSDHYPIYVELSK